MAKYKLNLNVSVTGHLAAYSLHYKKDNVWHSSELFSVYGNDKDDAIVSALVHAITLFGADHIASVTMFHDPRTLNDELRKTLRAVTFEYCGRNFYPFIAKDSGWQKEVAKHADKQWHALKYA